MGFVFSIAGSSKAIGVSLASAATGFFARETFLGAGFSVIGDSTVLASVSLSLVSSSEDSPFF
jgi:hypothetical protein